MNHIAFDEALALQDQLTKKKKKKTIAKFRKGTMFQKKLLNNILFKMFRDYSNYLCLPPFFAYKIEFYG